MKDVEAAWLAGLIDGEGAIWCRWPKRTNVVIEVKMTHLPTLERINLLFPGRLVLGQLSLNAFGRAPQYRWSIDTLGAERLLVRILPYMVTKREAAIAALNLCKRPVDAIFMDQWALVLRECNQARPPKF